MKLDENAKQSVQNLSDAINQAISNSVEVNQQIESLRLLGYEPNMTIKMEVALDKFEPVISDDLDEFFAEDLALELTEEDLRTLQRMKIRF